MPARCKYVDVESFAEVKVGNGLFEDRRVWQQHYFGESYVVKMKIFSDAVFVVVKLESVIVGKLSDIAFGSSYE